MKYTLLLTLVTLATSRPQKSLYSKGITSYGTPISDNALNINLGNLQNPPKNQLENSKYIAAPTQEIKPLNDEYKPVPQVSSLPLDKSALDRNDNKPKKDPVVHTHVYVHVPPPEEDDQKKGQLSLPPPQKHYKIIFIQTPTQKTPSTLNLQVPQPEEKTLIYVLYKKPEELTIPSSTSSPVINKPEVYFIKYKSNQEAINTVSNAVNSVGSSYGYDPKDYDKVGKITDLITGGSISDALLGAGTLPNFSNESLTEETTTEKKEVSTIEPIDFRGYS